MDQNTTKYFHSQKSVKTSATREFSCVSTGCDTISVFEKRVKGRTQWKSLQRDSDLQQSVEIFNHPTTRPDRLVCVGEKFIMAIYGADSLNKLLILDKQNIARQKVSSTFNLTSSTNHKRCTLAFIHWVLTHISFFTIIQCDLQETKQLVNP